jgi:ubiquinone/menaquinone biosynthesis C-methylase UbiE
VKIKLYSELAQVYHEMYQTIFNYEEEFNFYDAILKKYNCHKILELGCGSGNLARYFVHSGYDYTGVDLYDSMLEIAAKVEPAAKFIQGDMRQLDFENEFDAVIITGRSFTYMTKNDDVDKALKTIYQSLKENGKLIFDNFDAEKIFANFNREEIIFETEFENRKYKRVSKNSMNLETGWTWNWQATYYIMENNKIKTVRDNSILRAFTEDELRLFLKINRFEVLKVNKEYSAIKMVTKKYKRTSITQ